MPVPKDYPLEAFSPRFEELLLRAARGEDLSIRCRSVSEAYRLQHMLHNYRTRARQTFGDAKPERWKPLFTAIVGMLKDAEGKKTIVRLYCRHKEFGDLFDNIESKPQAPDAPLLREDPLAEFDPKPEAKPEGSGG